MYIYIYMYIYNHDYDMYDIIYVYICKIMWKRCALLSVWRDGYRPPTSQLCGFSDLGKWSRAPAQTCDGQEIQWIQRGKHEEWSFYLDKSRLSGL